LQSQTNLLGTNWVNVADSTQTNQMVWPLNTATGALFLRLMLP
jgi:hypothetical protein